jgi:hypothetical protein
MSYTEDDIRVGDIWYSKHFKGSWAVITGNDYDGNINYDYFFGHNDTGKYGDKTTGSISKAGFLYNFKIRSGFNKLIYMQKCIDKIKRS